MEDSTGAQTKTRHPIAILEILNWGGFESSEHLSFVACLSSEKFICEKELSYLVTRDA